MEDMTYDMAGSATVVGLMKNLFVNKCNGVEDLSKIWLVKHKNPGDM